MAPSEKIVKSPMAPMDPSVLKNNLGRYFMEHLKKHPSQLLIDGTTGKQITFEQAAKQAESARKAFQEVLKVPDGAAFDLLLPPDVHNIIVQIACWLVNGFTTKFKKVEMTRMQDVDVYGDHVLKAHVVVCVRQNLNIAAELKRRFDWVKHVICLPYRPNTAETDVPIPKGIWSWESILEAGEKVNDCPLRPIDPSKPAYAPFTSGTTGPAKLVVLTHESMIACSVSIAYPELGPWGSSDTMLSTTHTLHAYSLACCIARAIVRGHNVISTENNQPNHLVELMAKYRVSSIGTTPYHVYRIVTEADKEKCRAVKDLKCIFTASHPIVERHVNMALQLFPSVTVFIQSYGSTEVPTCFFGEYGRGITKALSMGAPAASLEAKLCDPQDPTKTLGPKENGELYVRGPQVFSYYYGHKPPADKWFKIGDSCYYDEDGYFFFLSRTKDFIKSRGHTVSPTFVEQAMMRNPNVVDCGAVGVPSKACETDEDICLIVHVKEMAAGTPVQRKALSDFFNEHSPYKLTLPHEDFFFVDTMDPFRNAMGKLDRNKMRDYVIKHRNAPKK